VPLSRSGKDTEGDDKTARCVVANSTNFITEWAFPELCHVLAERVSMGGPYVARYALFPTRSLQESLEKIKIDDSSNPEQHSIWLRDYFSKNEATYDLRVHTCQSLRQQPVEDTSVP
jgi:hypothetical protein